MEPDVDWVIGCAEGLVDENTFGVEVGVTETTSHKSDGEGWWEEGSRDKGVDEDGKTTLVSTDVEGDERRVDVDREVGGSGRLLEEGARGIKVEALDNTTLEV